MSITKEEAIKQVMLAALEREEAIADLRRAHERLNRASHMMNAALALHGKFAQK